MYGVRVAPSIFPSAGYGLFALCDFKAGQWIAPVTGEVISDAELEKRYGDATAPYVVLYNGQHLDGAFRRYVGQNSNSVFGSVPLLSHLALLHAAT